MRRHTMRDSLVPNSLTSPEEVEKSYTSANAGTSWSTRRQTGPVIPPEKQQQQATPGPSKTTTRQGIYTHTFHLWSSRPNITDSIPLTSLPRKKNEGDTFGASPNLEAGRQPPALTLIIPTKVTMETERPVEKPLHVFGRGGAGKVVLRKDKGKGKERAIDADSGGATTPTSTSTNSRTSSSVRTSSVAPSLTSAITNGDGVEEEGVPMAPVRLVVKKRSVETLGGFGRGGLGKTTVIGEKTPAVLSAVAPSPIKHGGDADGSIWSLSENLEAGSPTAATQNSEEQPTTAERKRAVPQRPAGARPFGRGGAGKMVTIQSGEGSSKGKGKAREEDRDRDKAGKERRHTWFGKRRAAEPSSSKTILEDEDDVLDVSAAAAAALNGWPLYQASESGEASTTSHPSRSSGYSYDRSYTDLSPSTAPSSPLQSSLWRRSRATSSGFSPPPPSRPLPTPPQSSPSQPYPSSNAPPPAYINQQNLQPHHDLLSLVNSKRKRWSLTKKPRRRPRVQAGSPTAATAAPPIEHNLPEEEEDEEFLALPPPPYERVASETSPVSAVTLSSPLSEGPFS